MTNVLRLLLLTLGSAVLQVGNAQEPPEPSRFRDPEDGQFDVSSFLEKPRGFLPVPVIVTEPAVGYGGGLVGMFLRPREQAGEQGWARPNISAVGAMGTENGTRAAFAGDASRWLDGRVKTLAGLGGGHINLDFYGLGVNRASLDEAIRYSLDFDLLFLQGTWQLKPKSPWSIGLRYVYAQVEPNCATSRCSPASPLTSTSTSRRRPASSSSTVATTSSRRPAGSLPKPCS